MSIPMLQACVEGYQEKLFDEQCMAVHQGYWAGYYQSKKPKSAKSVLEKMIREHLKSKKKIKNVDEPKPEVDISRFMELEAKREQYMASRRRK